MDTAGEGLGTKEHAVRVPGSGIPGSRGGEETWKTHKPLSPCNADRAGGSAEMFV